MEEEVQKSTRACHQSSALTSCISPRAGDRSSGGSSFLGQEETKKEETNSRQLKQKSGNGEFFKEYLDQGNPTPDRS